MSAIIGTTYANDAVKNTGVNVVAAIQFVHSCDKCGVTKITKGVKTPQSWLTLGLALGWRLDGNSGAAHSACSWTQPRSGNHVYCEKKSYDFCSATCALRFLETRVPLLFESLRERLSKINS